MKKILKSKYIRIMSFLDKLELILKIISKIQYVTSVFLCIYFVWSSDWLFIKLAATNLLISFLTSYLKRFVLETKKDYNLKYETID